MRILVDSLIAMMLAAVLGGVVWAHRAQERQTREHQQLYRSLANLHEQAVYHGAMGDVELTETGFPRQISPNWFEQVLPLNVLVDSRQPWIDVAPPGDMSDHPPDPVLNTPNQAGFWYNPNRGVFRARVPALMTDQTTLDLYNQINQSKLAFVPPAMDLARQPIAHYPLPVTTVCADPALPLRSHPLQDPMPASEEVVPVNQRPTLRTSQ